MKPNRITIYSIVAGIVFGVLGGPVYILIPWAIASLIIGYVSKTRKDALVNGFLFGFFASFFFMWHGYNGAAPVIIRFPFFAGLGGFGGVCGLILSLIGNASKKLSKK